MGKLRHRAGISLTQGHKESNPGLSDTQGHLFPSLYALPSLRVRRPHSTIYKCPQNRASLEFPIGSVTSLADVWALVYTCDLPLPLGFLYTPRASQTLLPCPTHGHTQHQTPAIPANQTLGSKPTSPLHLPPLETDHSHPVHSSWSALCPHPQPISHRGLSSLCSYSSPSFSSSHPHGSHPPQLPAPSSSGQQSP